MELTRIGRELKFKNVRGGITYLQNMATALHGCDNKSTSSVRFLELPMASSSSSSCKRTGFFSLLVV
jgi:hypothetical protein